MRVSALLLAAGRGLRLKNKTPKPLINLCGKPVIIHSLKLFSSLPQVSEIIIAANKQNEAGIKKAISKWKINKVKCLVRGGALRQDSVNNALKKVSAKCGLVLIHDAGRPFVSSKAVKDVIKEAHKFKAAILGVPVKATIKAVGCGNIVKKTLLRKGLWEIQTPQVFKRELIFKAYQKFAAAPVTDDAGLIEMLGVKVKTVMGSYRNIKITTPEDLLLAQAIGRVLR